VPVIPSYTGFAATPNAAQAYSAGAHTRLGYAQIAQQAQEAAARIALGREQLQQQAIANEMDLAAKKEALANEALRRAQENEIEKAYRETQLGLRQRELQGQEAMNALKIQEAARDFDAQQQFTRILNERIAAGDDPNEAAKFAAISVGPRIPGFSPSLSASSSTPQSREAASIRGKKLSSDLHNADAEMREQRKLLEKAETPEEKNIIMGRLASISRKRNALFQEQQTTTPRAASAPALNQPPQWQVPPQAIPFGAPKTSMFMGTPASFDASGFPSLEPPAQFNMSGMGVTSPQANRVRVLSVRQR
jgi:hypothetical protein